VTEARYPLEVVFELVDLASGMVAARYRREHPGAGDDEVEAAVIAWLGQRPGAPDGDAVGRLVPWPRPPRLSRPSS
jgi:Rv0078B-related antitoxin